MGLTFKDMLNKLGIYIPEPHSSKFRNNILPVKLYANVLIGGVWHNVEISDITFGKCGDTDNLCSLTFVGEENQDLISKDEKELTVAELTFMNDILGGY